MIRKRSARAVLAAAIALTAAVSGLAQAAPESGIAIKNMSMDLRPEYDTNDVLLIYDFALTNTGSSAYSDKVIFHVPKGATNQVHICEQVGDNKHANCRPYETSDTADGQLMTWKPSKPIEPGQTYPIYVEYYYNPIQGQADKTIDFLYHPSYPVENLDLTITQPLRSSNWSLDPAPAQSGGTGDGMTAYHYNWKNVAPDKPVQVAIKYTKADNKPSVAKTQVDAANAAAGMSTPAKVGIGVAMLGVFGGLLYLGLRPRSGRGHRTPPPVKVHTRPQQTPPRQAQAQPQQGRPTGRAAPAHTAADQRKKARVLLLEGKITEATYYDLIAEINTEGV